MIPVVYMEKKEVLFFPGECTKVLEKIKLSKRGV